MLLTRVEWAAWMRSYLDFSDCLLVFLCDFLAKGQVSCVCVCMFWYEVAVSINPVESNDLTRRTPRLFCFDPIF